MRTRMSGGMTGNAGDRLPMSICSGRSEGVKVLLCVAQLCGNDAPWKAWKTQKASFPLFPPRLEIRQKAPDSHISTAPTAAAPQTQLSRYSRQVSNRRLPEKVRRQALKLVQAQYRDLDRKSVVEGKRGDPR